jgi:UDP:flavonoid glycosyltransferase YjiC (YdhE family)
VARLGVGLCVARITYLTAEQLAEALYTTVHDIALRARAMAFGEQIRTENRIVHTVDVIERHAVALNRRLEATR